MNDSMVDYFVIRGMSDLPQLQCLIFLLVLVIYVITLGGNMTILLLVTMDHLLHTPMYFFLVNLSIMDMLSSTITLNKMLFIYVTKDHTISFFGCMTQVYLFSGITGNELLLMAAMSYDRYAAVCNPLHYTTIMSFLNCFLLSVICWTLGLLQAIPYVILLLRISCYKSLVINHFFCDLMPIMQLSCSNIDTLEILIYTEGLLLLNLTPCLLTFTPYIFIIISILKIKTTSGKHKAFYTCSSHLTVVVILYVSLGCQYLTPVSADKKTSNKLFSLFNTAAVPLLNPLIYSLRNKDVKAAFVRKLKVVKQIIS
ncbi:olfactory receptor 8G17-like [Leptodactylus fuscus]|uniref:olfactory receptor 8G17-like n=1 Tax=Leptodactylus fuscus TaxID=238119 RepID=UPI003F4F001D